VASAAAVRRPGERRPAKPRRAGAGRTPPHCSRGRPRPGATREAERAGGGAGREAARGSEQAGGGAGRARRALSVGSAVSTYRRMRRR